MDSSGGIEANLQAQVPSGLGARYATALFELADERSASAAVEASMARLAEAHGQSAELRALTADALIARDQAARAVGAVARTLGLDPLTTDFLGVLAANRRLAALPMILRAFDALAANRRGEVSARVVSAHPLDAVQTDALRAALKARVGRDVSVSASVDPAILGGLVVTIGSTQIDSSLRTRLNTLAQAMKG